MTMVVWATILAQAAAGPGADGPKGSIQGTVVNEVTGAPVKKARVSLSRMDGAAPPGNAVTDASGGFSFQDLPAGKYRLQADHPDYPGSAAERAGSYGIDVNLQSGEDKRGVGIALTPTGAVSGKVTDEDGDPLTEAVVELLGYNWQGGRRTLSAERSGTTNDKGEYRMFDARAGRYYVRASSRRGIPLPHALLEVKDAAKLPELEYDTVFYPGTTEVSGAARLNLAAGGELRDINLRLPKLPAVRVSGKVEAPPDVFERQAGLQLFLVHSGTGDQESTDAGRDGGFVFDMVRPGAYVVELAFYPGYWARQEVTVGDAPVEGVMVRMQPAMEVTGEIEMEAAADGGAPPPGQMKVQLMNNSPGPFFGMLPQAATVADDGAFAIRGLIPGTYEVNVQGQPWPSYVKSLRLGDRDIQGTEIPISAGEAGPLKIVAGDEDGKNRRHGGGDEWKYGGGLFCAEPGGTIANQTRRGFAGTFSLGERRAGRVPGVCDGGGETGIFWAATGGCAKGAGGAEREGEGGGGRDGDGFADGDFAGDVGAGDAGERVSALRGGIFITAAICGILRLMAQGAGASVAGVVVDEATGATVRKAVVELYQEGEGQVSAQDVSDAQGRFGFSNLPPGKYRLRGERDGYEPRMLGAKHIGQPGVILTLAAGDARWNLRLTLAPYGAITGKVFDGDGDPIARMPKWRFCNRDGSEGSRNGNIGEARKPTTAANTVCRRYRRESIV